MGEYVRKKPKRQDQVGTSTPEKNNSIDSDTVSDIANQITQAVLDKLTSSIPNTPISSNKSHSNEKEEFRSTKTLESLSQMAIIDKENTESNLGNLGRINESEITDTSSSVDFLTNLEDW